MDALKGTCGWTVVLCVPPYLLYVRFQMNNNKLGSGIRFYDLSDFSILSILSKLSIMLEVSRSSGDERENQCAFFSNSLGTRLDSKTYE